MAQKSLGDMYRRGLGGVPQDDTEAVRWYRKAAEQGYPVAQSNLGSMYALGKGVKQDYVQAYMWFNIAAEHGDANARKNLDLAAKQMTADQIAKAQKLAQGWKSKK
jgi:hypothetical protein